MESTIKKTYPVTIDNGHGERLTFLGREVREGIEYVQVENQVSPGAGPPMHVHHLQHESLYINEGKMGVQIEGQEPYFLNVGDSATFHSGIAHRFWNAGDTTLRCTGEIWPPHNIEYFLSEIFQSSRQNSKGQPAAFDAAYLLQKYRTEFDMLGIPWLVKKVIFPIILFIGRLRGLDSKFKDAPAAV